MFNAHSRQKTLDSLGRNKIDLLVVGGGITGAGVARDASQRGLNVLLVEAHDFAFGTSSRSSKLVHGGIRYLENFEFGLVHEALMERRHLLQMAPHMVHPLRFLIPVYKSSRVGLFKMEAGMILYDLLSFFEAPEIHEFHLRESTKRREPLLKNSELTGSVVYSDAYMEDDRLVIETLRSAQRTGAQIVNYVQVVRANETEEGYVVDIVDRKTEKKYSVKTSHVVGCLGPWTDIFGAEALQQWTPVLRPTKGVHLIFSRERIPVRQAIVMAVEERIVFVIPREDIVIIGTTDTDFKDDPAQVGVDKQDVEYLLSVANNYFPTLKLQKQDILSCYSGVRPLVKDGANSEGKTSREHEIFKPNDKLTVVAGGKYTTYRAMAEEIVEASLRSFSFEKKMALRRPETTQPLNPAATSEKIDRLLLGVAEMAKDFGVSEKTVHYLINRRGEEAVVILNLMNLFKNESEEARLWLAEAKFCIENEMCLTLVDFYFRRSPLFLFRKDHGLSFAPKIASLFAQSFSGGSDTAAQKEVDELTQLIAKEKQALSVSN